MIWSVTLPGQPPTLNSLYTVVPRKAKDGRSYTGIGKSREARRWHDDMLNVIRSACPSRWAPTGQIRLSIRLFLTHDIDADNVLKVLSDAIQKATEVNDKLFLPCVISKEIVDLNHARVEVTLDDDE